jgi:thymidylate synthase
VSEAWLNAVQVVDAAPERRLFHLVTRISDPVTEEPRIRAAADALLRDLDLALVHTVANTIFPAHLAATSAGPGELAQRYRRMYPTLRRLHKSNRKGTYFGRIVAHPAAGGERDQLADLIERLRTELRTRGPKSARYEMNITGPGELDQPAEACPAEELSDGGPVHIYATGKDTSPMGFPCLSFCSFQLDGDTLHMVAQYRYQYLIERGYGNYLGLGQLLGYVSASVGLRPGQLMIIAGVAAVDSAARYRIARLTESAGAQ